MNQALDKDPSPPASGPDIVRPGAVDALVQRAVAEHKSGRLPSAEGSYKRALSLDPGHPEANHNLGIILAQRGALQNAIPLLRKAIEADPDRELYRLSCARALLLAGRAPDAAALLEEARSLGISGPGVDALLAQIESVAGAVPGVPAAASAPPSSKSHDHEQRGCALARAGRFSEAVDAFRAALAGAPADRDRLLLQLAGALMEAGATEEAIDTYREAIAANPLAAEAHYHLGAALSQKGRIGEGFAHFMQRAELVAGSGGAPAEHRPALAHVAKHEREQRAYLAKRGLATPRSSFHVGEGNRLPGAAVNGANASPDLFERWRNAQPQFVIIDDFLTAPALEKLRAYCAESTIWSRVYEAGYIGATPGDGFACPLLAQIAEETDLFYNEIFGAHPFRYLGAFKYDSALSTGTNTHADLSAVNLNLYIAPDEANLDPETGGMIIWNRAAASEAEMRRYNTDEPGLQHLLKSSGARATRIAHRSNRAVIFNSALFHKSDVCRFKEGYLNKRINVSLLFGDWGAKTD